MVAARAGVSRATVSRVVNGSPKVSPDVATAVHEAIAALNYVPNRAARSLASRRTQAIALVVPESTARVFNDPFFATLVQGVGLALADTEYTLSMLIESEATFDKTRRYLLGGNVDGALVVSHHTGDHSYAQRQPVAARGVRRAPARLRPRASTTRSTSTTRTARRSRRSTSSSAGRTRIATIAGPQDMPPGVDRLRGFVDALVRRRARPPTRIEYGDFSPASGAIAMRRLLERDPTIDAVFAANDQMAIGRVLGDRRSRGARIPGDVAVVGFDDDRYAATAVPPLTTVHQPSLEMGAEMARVLVRLIDGETCSPRRSCRRAW